MKGLGERIKKLRKKKGLTILDVTDKTGIDKATLSRIENGKMRGTVNVHLKIANALDVRLPDLYDDVLTQQGLEEEKMTKDKVETFSHASGAVTELLTSGVLQKKMLPVLVKIKPSGQTELEEYPMGTERFVIVIKGSLTLYLQEQEILLKKNDSLYFNAAKKHYFLNAAKSMELHVLSIITPVSL